ncbi:MAG: diguanylate cyclase [Campylobacterota bacterium]|nr:diguanylate cyclase [Campylobacterota bacterium]
MSRWYTLHIKNEILFWFFILALIPLLVLSSINYFYQKELYINSSKDHLRLILNQKLQTIDNYIELASKETNIISKTPFLKESMGLKISDFKMENYFKDIVVQNDFYDLFLINKNGDIVYSVQKESDLNTNLVSGIYSNTNLAKVFKNTLSMIEIQISDFEYYEPSKMDAAFISTPIYKNELIIGVLAIQLNTKKLYDIFNNSEGLGTTGEFFAARLDKNNNVISTTPLKNNKKSVTSDFRFGNNPDLPIYKAVHGNRGVMISKDYVGDKIVAAWGYVPELQWGVVVKQDLKEVLSEVSKLGFYSIVVLFFVGLGVVVAILLAIRHIVSPIEKLTNGVQNFAKGKFYSDVNVDVDNEIGELSKNFNDMASTLRVSQETIQKYAQELEEKVKIRTKELEEATIKIELSNKQMQDKLDIIDKHVITSSTNLSGTITEVSSAFCKITGYTVLELIGKKHNIVRHPDMSKDIYEGMWKTITKGDIWSGDIKNQRRDGSFYWVSSTISPIFDDDKKIKGYTSIRKDITNEKRVEELSITDQLTQLYNRVKLEDVYISEIQRANRYNQPFSMILLDIDHFKMVNDTYGHDVGDETLKDVANILKQSVRNTDIVGRWGGEEFIVITSQTNLEQTMILAEKIRKNIESHQFKVIGTKTSSFGVSTYHNGDTQETLVKRADDALYKAKHGGRNCVVTLEE